MRSIPLVRLVSIPAVHPPITFRTTKKLQILSKDFKLQPIEVVLVYRFGVTQVVPQTPDLVSVMLTPNPVGGVMDFYY